MNKLELGELLSYAPKLHKRSNGELTSDWKIDEMTCRELDRRLSPGMRTLETGAGLSTIIFADNGCRHTCIVPDQALVDRIIHFCAENQVSTSGVDFIISNSTDAIHQLDGQFDLTLIDGCHGFPVAMVDFYYAARLLKFRGLMIIDDLHIFTCRVIASFMAEDVGWDVQVHTGRVAFAEKIADTIDAEWTEQSFIVKQGDAGATITFATPVAALKATIRSLHRHGGRETMRKILSKINNPVGR